MTISQNMKPKLLQNMYFFHLSQALDPENGPVSYSIVSGNELREFGINAKTGVISVIRKLDREQLTQYQLVRDCSF